MSESSGKIEEDIPPPASLFIFVLACLNRTKVKAVWELALCKEAPTKPGREKEACLLVIASDPFITGL